MAKICKVTFNDTSFLATCGDLLLDSAMMNGVEIPHDCRAGICGACKVRLVEGRVYGGQDEHSEEMIHACQARVVSDLEIITEEVPETVMMPGRVVRLTRLAPDVIGVCIEIPKPLERLAGQFCKVQFRGFPARCYSPTFPLEGTPNDRLLHFHIRVVDDGLVSTALGRQIRVGHRVKINGPLGMAFLRPNHPGGMVIVASGTGFAPMWSIAVAAIFERPERKLTFIVSGRKLQSMYMNKALCRLALFPNVTIIPVVSEAQTVTDAVRVGRPTNFMPPLTSNDVVYTGGNPAMTKTVAEMAKAVGAQCYTDPFVSDPTPVSQPGLMSWVTDWIADRAAGGSPAPSRMGSMRPRGA
jgi:3-phenylpropionate/trans-cinnamate dioxygenase ferredoxin reductase subunit